MLPRIFSIKNKIILVVAVMIVVVGSLTAYAVYWQTSQNLLTFQKQTIQKLIVERANSGSRRFVQFQQLVQLTSHLEIVKDYLQQPTPELKDQIIQGLKSVIKDNPQYVGLAILDKTGQAVIATDSTLANESHASKPYFKLPQEGKAATEAVYSETDQKIGYFVSYPVSKQGEFLGVVLLKLNSDAVGISLTDKELEKAGNVFLVDDVGVVVYSMDPKLILHSLTQLPPQIVAQVENDNRYKSANIKSLGYDALSQTLEKPNSGSGILEFYDQTSQKKKLFVYAPLPETPYFVVVDIKIEEMNKIAIGNGRLIGFGVMIAAILTIFIVTFFIERILSPIKNVKKFADQIKQGDFSQRIKITTNDEFEYLANVLNDMADDLSVLYHNMEEAVKQKTLDLEEKVGQLENTKKAMINLVEDIENEKNKTLQQTQELQKFKLAVDNSFDHIVITDADGLILYANEAVERITGFKREEIMGKKAGNRELWGGLMSQDFYQTMWQVLKKEKKSFVGEVTNKHKDGSKYFVQATISPIVDQSGEVIFFVGIERDITREKETDKAKTEFVSLASHQLRGPVTSINWFAELLLNGDVGSLTPDQNQYVSEIADGGQKMADLINALLNVSRLELGTFMVEPQPVNLAEILKQTVEELRSLIEEKKTNLNFNVPAELSIFNADKVLMGIIIQNLLSNAVKYTAPEGHVTVNVEKIGDRVRLSVIDDGYGIPEDEKNKTFDKLFRASNVVKHDVGGTGLGLYIVKSVVENSGGKIWFDSKENQGTSFYIEYPISGMVKKSGSKQLTPELNSDTKASANKV